VVLYYQAKATRVHPALSIGITQYFLGGYQQYVHAHVALVTGMALRYGESNNLN
jgi:hypothetical protein